MRYLLPGAAAGGFFVFLALVIIPALPTVHAQDISVEVEKDAPGIVDSLSLMRTRVCAVGACLLAIVFATVAGVRAAGREGGWPHWAGLARGLGDAAFLLSVLLLFSGLHEAIWVLARMGAAVTYADMADGLMASAAYLGLGAFAALAGLLGAGLIRFREIRASR